jgi:FkbM family methyltransferase
VQEFLKRAADSTGLGPPLRRALGRGDAGRSRSDNAHLRRLLAFCLKPDSNCIDIGSHHGTVLAEMLRVAPQGLHIAYEPLQHLCLELRQRFPQVDVRCAALSNVEGESSFAYVKNLEASSGLRQTEYWRKAEVESIIVHTERLDDHLDANYLPTLLKIDVEGAEGLVLQGAINTLARHQPIVVFEHGKGGAEYYDTTPADVFSLLCVEARLRIFDLDGKGPYSLEEFESTFEANYCWNFVAHR